MTTPVLVGAAGAAALAAVSFMHEASAGMRDVDSTTRWVWLAQYQRLGHGECVLDPAIVNRLLNRAREPGPLDELSPRDREILTLMAEGHSNERICELSFLSPTTVEPTFTASL